MLSIARWQLGRATRLSSTPYRSHKKMKLALISLFVAKVCNCGITSAIFVSWRVTTDTVHSSPSDRRPPPLLPSPLIFAMSHTLSKTKDLCNGYDTPKELFRHIYGYGCGSVGLAQDCTSTDTGDCVYGVKQPISFACLLILTVAQV